MDNKVKQDLLNIINVGYELKNILTDKQIDEILDFMIEDGSGNIVEITDKYSGNKQEENYWFKYIYIDQKQSYEDSFYGDIYIPLPNNKYFHFNYYC
jgi:hypothetical protein